MTDDHNPFEAPLAESSPVPTPISGKLELTGPRKIPFGRIFNWIPEGFGYFKAAPGGWILALIIMIAIQAAVSMIPIVGQIAMSLTTYVWFGGLIAGCHAIDRGEPFDFKYVFAGFERGRNGLILLSVISGFAATVVLLVSIGPAYFELIKMGIMDAEPDPEAIEDLFTFGLLVRGVLATIVLLLLSMAFAFAPALIVLNGVPVIQSLKLSLAACLRNFVPLFVFGLLAILAYFIAIIPLGLGMLVLGPCLVAAVYISYKDIFIEEQEPTPPQA